MHLTKCELGHIYDTEKFRSCPHCYSANMTQEDEEDALGAFQADKSTEQASVEETRQFYVLHRRKTVGMLICIEGQMKGDAFLLKEGDNIIGRGSNMDVALTMEETISRQSHATIDFDEKKGVFTLSYNKERDDVLVNGRRPKTGKTLAGRDQIQLGDCKLILIEAGDVWENRMD